MKHIKPFILNEQKLTDAKKELKHFQDVLELDVTIDDLMDSIEATKLDLNSLFPSLKGNERMDKLPENKDFMEELKKLGLKLSELNDTDSLQTFSRLPMRWYWIYKEDSSDLEIPINILYRYFYEGEWSDIKLYYVQKEIDNFLDELSLVTIELRHEKDEENMRWFYTTSNSGKNWTLQDTPKKIKEGEDYKTVKSAKPTASFRKSMDWQDILNMANHPEVKLFIY